MRYGFYLFVDEAGDEGLDRLRSVNGTGSSEYFVLCGALIRTTKYNELKSVVQRIKAKIGHEADAELHFRALPQDSQKVVISEIAKMKIGLVAIVSNKRNMIGYRNQRCEAVRYEIVRGRRRPQHYNWFYNGLFRYMLERASAECARWNVKAYGEYLPIKVIFARRKNFSYAQTVGYLYRLQVSRHGKGYWNNRGSINWSTVSLSGIESCRPKNEIGLQVADCAASAIFRALDENWFGEARPSYLQELSTRFIATGGTPRDYGFKLLPDGFAGPVSFDQKVALRAVGYKL